LNRHHEKRLGGSAAVVGPEPCNGLAEALSVAEAAARTGVSRTFLYEHIASGELPTVKLGKRRLVRVAALRAWLERLECKPVA
jgi:excisionase family DNA binding protein